MLRNWPQEQNVDPGSIVDPDLPVEEVPGEALPGDEISESTDTVEEPVVATEPADG